MNDFNVALGAISAMVVGFALVSRGIARSVFTPALLAMLSGAVLGPDLLAAVHVPSLIRFDVLQELTRLSLAIALMGTALSLPTTQLASRMRAVGLLLSLGLIAAWLITGLLAFGLLNMPLTTALLIGAILSPTDPVLARSVTTAEIATRNVPPRIRNRLLEESGFNDGFAYPIVLLMLTIMLSQGLVRHWLLDEVLYAVVANALLGLAIGWLMGVILRNAHSRESVSPNYYVLFAIGFAFLTVFLARLAGMDGILTVFVAGLAFSYTQTKKHRQRQAELAAIIDEFMTLPVFFVFGLILPWRAWLDLGWPALAFVAATLLLRRLPAVLALSTLLRPHVRNFREALFVGWFGPMGVSALFYAAYTIPRSDNMTVWAVVSLVVFGSVIVFGATASPLSRALGQRHSTEKAEKPEERAA